MERTRQNKLETLHSVTCRIITCQNQGKMNRLAGAVRIHLGTKGRFVNRNMPRVSVLIGVHNGEPFLRDSIDSLLNQTFDDFELIIVDDASTDTSLETLGSISDPRVTIQSLPENRGLAHALNRGLTLAKGEYIARQDADDISLPERFQKQVDYLDQHPEVGVLATGVQIITETGEPNGTVIFPEHHYCLVWQFNFMNPIVHPSVMMRRSLLEQVGGYRELKVTQDYDLWVRLRNLTRFSTLQEVLVHFRKHQGSVSSVYRGDQITTGREVRLQLMAEFWGKKIDPESLTILRNYSGNPVQAPYRVVFPATRMIVRLFSRFIKDKRLSDQEKTWIYKNVLHRLYLGFTGKRRKDIRYWLVYARYAWLKIRFLHLAKNQDS